MATKLSYAQALKSPPPSLMEASSGQTMSRLAPAKKPKGARRNTVAQEWWWSAKGQEAQQRKQGKSTHHG